MANAATLGSLPVLIDAAGPGGEVRLLADQGAYHVTAEVDITAGGADGAPVTIRGVDSSGNPMAAEIVGTRAENWSPGQSNGLPLFRLLPGADNLAFQDLTTRNFGNGVFRIGAGPAAQRNGQRRTHPDRGVGRDRRGKRGRRHTGIDAGRD
jgi:hypothetical protein